MLGAYSFPTSFGLGKPLEILIVRFLKKSADMRRLANWAVVFHRKKAVTGRAKISIREMVVGAALGAQATTSLGRSV